MSIDELLSDYPVCVECPISWMSHCIVSEEAGRIAAEGACVAVSFGYDAGYKVDLPHAWIEEFKQIEGAGFAGGREES